MADTSLQTQPITEDSLLADRMRMWSGFTSATMIAVVVVVVALILLAFITL